MMKRNSSKQSPCRRILTGLALAAILLAPSLLTACSSQEKSSHRSIIVAGSTSVQPFAEILAEEYMRLHPEVKIDIQGGGSSAGIKAAQSQTADIGMSSRDLKGDEVSLWSAEIARDGLSVVVHPDNPITDLTLAQVRDIYAETMTDWNQCGGSDERIHVFTREEGSGTRDAFTHLVMEKVEVTPRALVQDSNGAVRQLVGDDPAAIGYISMGLVNEKVKALSLDHVVPSSKNIYDGSYQLSRPFLFVANSEPTGEAKAFIDFVLSEDGQKILSGEGLVTQTSGDTP